MKKVDYIIVGLGIAGLAFAETLLKNNKSFIIFDDGHKGATSASGGILNPTVLKRFTAAWNVEEFTQHAIPFYENIGLKLQTSIIKPIGINRILNNVEEQNNWIVASDKDRLKPFLVSELINNTNKSINAPFKLGSVNLGYQIHPAILITAFRKFLNKNKFIVSENFNHNLVELQQDSVSYKEYTANNLVFAEGAKVVKNPLFPLAISPILPKVFVGNKGEYIIIKAPKLNSPAVLKGPMMIIPLGDDLYKVGASYGRDDFSMDVTKEAREQISAKLKTMINCDFEVVDQVAGIRPTVKDRKPLLGVLPTSKRIAFLNGLGTRGLTMAPLLAKQLFDLLENNIQLPAEIDLKRFL